MLWIQLKNALIAKKIISEKTVNFEISELMEIVVYVTIKLKTGFACHVKLLDAVDMYIRICLSISKKQGIRFLSRSQIFRSGAMNATRMLKADFLPTMP